MGNDLIDEFLKQGSGIQNGVSGGQLERYIAI
jgi:hypothetical protein